VSLCLGVRPDMAIPLASRRLARPPDWTAMLPHRTWAAGSHEVDSPGARCWRLEPSCPSLPRSFCAVRSPSSPFTRAHTHHRPAAGQAMYLKGYSPERDNVAGRVH
jgi:hypothetical protein